MKQGETLKKGIIICFFALFLLYGIVNVKDYGISVDEMVERKSSLVTYKFLVPSVVKYQTDTVDFASLDPLSEWKDRYYGVAMQLPTVFVEHLTGFTMPMNQVVYVRHLYVFLLFFISSLFFYRIAKRITKNEVQAIVGTAIYILCPRILAHSFFNIKDSVFLSVFVINLFSAICFIEGAKWKAVIGLAITTALCVNTRIVGAVVIVLTLVLAIAKALYYRENIRCLLYTSRCV